MQSIKITVIGFCFSGHEALITTTLSEVSNTFNFYGAWVTTTRPGGGSPSLELLNKTSGKLTCICGTGASLISLTDQVCIKNALLKEYPSQSRFNYVEIEDADHGFMCEQRATYQHTPLLFAGKYL